MNGVEEGRKDSALKRQDKAAERTTNLKSDSCNMTDVESGNIRLVN